MTTTALPQQRPWYREFWVWFLIALPASVVIASISTIFLAVGGADALVVDNFQKVGLVARRETGQERLAAALHVVAVTSIDRRTGQVTLRLEADTLPRSLRFGLHHPTQPGFDRVVDLERDAAGLFRGNVGELQGHWHVQVTDLANGWRMSGKLGSDQQLMELRGGN